MYPGGPSKLVVKGNWFENMGKCSIAGTTLVRNNANHPFNRASKFTFIETCYTIPVAVWPYDPFNKLPANHPRRQYFDIIDRNQTEIVS
jgi:hypothetical protein